MKLQGHHLVVLAIIAIAGYFLYKRYKG